MQKLFLLPIFLLGFVFAEGQTPFTVCATMPRSSITGSGYNSSCVPSLTDTGCVYHLSVTIPPWATITDVIDSFGYKVVAPNWIQNGSFRLKYLGCSSQLFTCPIPVPGVCWLPHSIFSDIDSCFPPLQCHSYTMDFELHIFRCIGSPTSGCDSLETGPTSDWTICVSGTTTPCAGIDEINIGNWKYFPNPTSDKIIFESSSLNKKDCTFILYDVYGREIKSEEIISSSKFEISLKDFSSGVYFFKIMNGEVVMMAGKVLKD